MGTCEECGSELIRTGSRGRVPTRWCSDKCRQIIRNRRKREALLADRERKDRKCVVCREPIPDTARAGAVVCSKSCRIALNIRKRSETRHDAWHAENRLCAYCGEPLPVPESGYFREKYCSATCKKFQQGARWRAKSPGYMRKYYYGLSDGQFQALLDGQGGVCAICGTSEWGGNSGNPNVDHDHDCDHPGKGVLSCAACVRGLLCDFCNRGIGMLREDPARLRAAADYLERYSCGTLFSIAG